MTSEEIKALDSQYICIPTAGFPWPSTTARAPALLSGGQRVHRFHQWHRRQRPWLRQSAVGGRHRGAGQKAGPRVQPVLYGALRPPGGDSLQAHRHDAGVFFANGGGEANEGMIKLARKYSFDKYGKGRATIITLKNSFHGRTITTLMAATGQEACFHNYFLPLHRGLPLCGRQLSGLAGRRPRADDVCAVMVELIQGEGGVLPLDREYVQAGGRHVRGKGLAAAGGRGAERRGPHGLSVCLPAVRHSAGCRAPLPRESPAACP
jgi:hypothetical protein